MLYQRFKGVKNKASKKTFTKSLEALFYYSFLKISQAFKFWTNCYFKVCYTSYSNQVKTVAILNGGGAYGVNTINSHSRKGEALCPYRTRYWSCLPLVDSS